GDPIEALVSLHGKRDTFAPLTDSQVREIVGSDVEWIDLGNDLRPSSVIGGLEFIVQRSPHPICTKCKHADRTVARDLCARCAHAGASTLAALPVTVPSASVRPEMRPADVARWLRERDIRKVAILRDKDALRVWALHAPSQEVRPVEALQPLADYIAASPDYD